MRVTAGHVTQAVYHHLPQFTSYAVRKTVARREPSATPTMPAPRNESTITVKVISAKGVASSKGADAALTSSVTVALPLAAEPAASETIETEAAGHDTQPPSLCSGW